MKLSNAYFFVGNPTKPRYESGINVFVKKLFFSILKQVKWINFD